MISLIWAQTRDNIIGKDNNLPWNIKEEMKHFVNYTRGKTVLMGRNTFESLKIKPLPNRKNIVITSRPMELEYNDIVVCNNLKTVFENYKNKDEELVVIGGAKVYTEAIKYADKLVISVIKDNYDGDVYFPNWNKDDFILKEEVDMEKFVIYIYERK
ncbi:dihydrofolate reductase [Spiroplasma turonicum]|uniref:Dihydrofolate reductase n=1 Tax=Spiroplasma turonicum TaxID=216946 RepID=A0A0K1P5E7_9MOLU|nr:dihydrofolate reductase [Spiroplasma turonicum]AKU79503.1 dihydrofolate reductase [Spiroplasma turonicum]ALX70525.1 dihydrofolate reductase [Spiroplasma turonicum]